MRIARTVVVIALCLTALSGCHWQTAGEEIARPIEDTPTPISTGDCHLDLSGGKEVTVFRTLGMLSEYLGRQLVEDSDIVERFYVEERPAAEAFRRLTQQLASEQGLDPPSVDQTSGLSYFRSRALTERIDSCYADTMTERWRQQGPNGTMVRGTAGSLPLELFMRSGVVTEDPAGGESNTTLYRQRALAYLSGAWLRSHRGADLVFANGQKKSALIAELLHRLGASDVTIESTIGLIPQTNVVHFTPTPLITEWLNRAGSALNASGA